MALTYEVSRDERLVTIRGDYETADDWRVILAAVIADLRGHTGSFAVLRDRRVATVRADAQTAVAMAEVISEWWSGLRLCGIAILTHTAHDVPAQMAVAIADSRGIPLRAFDAEDAALSWLRGLVAGADRDG